MTNQEFKVASFGAYCGYVEFMEGKCSMKAAIDKMFPAFYEYGHKVDESNFVRVVTVYMTAMAKEDAEKVRKVKSISTFRKLIKTDWDTVENARVSSKAGKAPEEKTSKKKIDISKEVKASIASAQEAGIDITALIAEAMKEKVTVKA